MKSCKRFPHDLLSHALKLCVSTALYEIVNANKTSSTNKNAHFLSARNLEIQKKRSPFFKIGVIV